MILKRSAANLRRLERCHDGVGGLWCSELLADYKKEGVGFAFIHDNVIGSGASIGEHVHRGDEEVCVILSGRGVMRVDGMEHEVVEGDVCLTRSGHSHALVNDGDDPMRFLVINGRLPSSTSSASDST